MTEPRIVGEAGVRIVPDATGWSDRVRAQLDPQADEIGRAIGNRIGEAMVRQIADSIDEISARLDLLGARDISVRLRVDDNGSLAAASAKVDAVDAAANNSSGGVGILQNRLVAIGAAAIAGADIAIPALLAIGAAAGGLIAAVGVGVLGFSGIGQALQAKGSPLAGDLGGSSGGGGGSGGQSAQQQAIAAQQRQLQATQSTRSAQDQLTQAIQSQAAAETALHDARAQALLDLIDMDNKLRDNQLAQQQNAITLDEARRKLAVILSAPGVNLPQYADQVAQAKLDVATAEQKQKELSQQGQQLAGQDAAAHKAGVEGATAVVKAKQQLVDANHKLAEAQLNVTETAEKNRLAAAAAAASLASAAGSADKFATAMANLNPLQQQFVDFLISMKPLLDELKLAASEFLPGLEQGIRDAMPAFEPLLSVVGNVAKAMGGVFESIGTALASPDGQKFLNFLATELPQQVTFLGRIFLDFGKLFAHVWEAAGPLIDAADRAITRFFDAAASGSRGSGLVGFFDSLVPLMPKLTDALLAIGRLFGQVFVALAPAMGPLLDVITLIADELASLAEPVLKPLAKAFGDLLIAFSPLVPVIGDFIKAVLPPLIKLLDTVINSGIAPLAVTIAAALLPLMKPLSAAFTSLVNAVAPLVEPLVQQIAPIIAPLAKALFDMFPAFVDLVAAVLPLVPPLARIAGDLLKMAVTALPLMLPALDLLSRAIDPVVRALTPFLNMLANILDKITAITNKLPDLNGVFGGGGGGGGNLFSNILTSSPLGILGHILGHAGGGDMQPGVPYQVGEVGPEIFVPRVPGTMIPADASRILGKALGNKPARGNNFFQIVTNDPLAAAHATANRFAARAI